MCLTTAKIFVASNLNKVPRSLSAEACTECAEATRLPYNCSINLTIENAPATDFAIDSAGGGGNWLYYYKYPQTAAKEWLDVEYADEVCQDANGNDEISDLCTAENDENAIKELKY